MIRHEFSYWLNIRTNVSSADFKTTADAITDALNDNECIWPKGPFVLDYHESSRAITGEVYPDAGTVEETADLASRIEKVVAAFPHIDIEFTEQDEEDKSVATLYRFSNGRKIMEQSARLIPCTRMYDETTVQKIIAFLESGENKQLAEDIRLNFSDI